MEIERLANRFRDTWIRCAHERADPAPVWQKLEEHYREPHRFYHDLGHLEHCLAELDAANGRIKEFDATEMAIWFHDIIYVYGAKDNEELSAVTFRECAANHMPEDFVERVCELIIATKHTGKAEDEGMAFLVDIDLSGFGLPWEGYHADSMALRKEAPEVSDEQYYQGKLRFLDALVGWPQIFQTEYFNDRLEANARANIQRFTTELREQGFSA